MNRISISSFELFKICAPNIFAMFDLHNELNVRSVRKLVIDNLNIFTIVSVKIVST